MPSSKKTNVLCSTALFKAEITCSNSRSTTARSASERIALKNWYFFPKLHLTTLITTQRSCPSTLIARRASCDTAIVLQWHRTKRKWRKWGWGVGGNRKAVWCKLQWKCRKHRAFPHTARLWSCVKCWKVIVLLPAHKCVISFSEEEERCWVLFGLNKCTVNRKAAWSPKARIAAYCSHRVL